MGAEPPSGAVPAAPLAKPAASTGPPVLRLSALTKRFGPVRAVDDISLEIAAPEIFALLGASGSGKTTMLRLLAGFERPDAGRIEVDGVDITEWPAHKRPINMMFQNYALFPHLSVFDNIAYGLRRRTPWWARGRAEKRAIADSVQTLARMLELDHLTGRRIHQLSGGQRQRVALARALSLEPRLLLLDEPLSALDRKLRETTQLELVRLHARLGLTFIIVTHDQEEAMALSDRLAVMRAGQIVQVGPPAGVYAHPVDCALADFLGTVTQFPGELGPSDAEGRAARCVATGTLFRLPPATLPSLADGARVTLALRPERLRVMPGATEGAANQVTGSVTDMAFLGDHWRVSLDLPTLAARGDGPFTVRVSLFADEQGRPPASYDRPLTLGWRSDAILVYAEEPSA